jgi:quercetin dioxygenase-like cupin family protein
MRLSDIPFGVTNWAAIEPTRHPGESGIATWRTRYFGPEDERIRVRLVEYSPGYVSDHWCSKGHILFCLEGSLETLLDDQRTFTLGPGMSYQVADGAEAHRSRTATGAKLLIVD